MQHGLNRKKIKKYLKILEQNSLFIISTEKKENGLLIQNTIFRTAIEILLLKDILTGKKTLHSSIYNLCSGENYLYTFTPETFPNIQLKEADIVGIFYLGSVISLDDLHRLKTINFKTEISNIIQTLQQNQINLVSILNNPALQLVTTLSVHSKKNGNV